MLSLYGQGLHPYSIISTATHYRLDSLVFEPWWEWHFLFSTPNCPGAGKMEARFLCGHGVQTEHQHETLFPWDGIYQLIKKMWILSYLLHMELSVLAKILTCLFLQQLAFHGGHNAHDNHKGGYQIWNNLLFHPQWGCQILNNLLF